jgi:hypothetical protein
MMSDKSLLILLGVVSALGYAFPIETTAITAILPALIAGGAMIGSSLIGSGKAGSERDQALALIQQSIKDLEAIGIPSVEAQQLALEKYRSAGKLTPELEQFFQQTDSKLNDIQVDPSLKQAQMSGLSKLQQVVDDGGMMLEDKANLAGIQNSIDASERGSREAILSNARQRGMSGSGLELAAQLQGQQAAATRSSTEGLNTAAQAQKRALDALMQRSQMAGDIRGQEYGEQSDAAKAQDLINQFNTRNRQDVQQRNVAERNAAQQYNLGNDQRIMDANTGLSNQQQVHNKGLIQSEFDNKMAKTSAANNARAGAANQHNANAKNTQETWTGIGQGINQGATAIGQQNRQDERDEKYGHMPGYWGSK